MGQSLLLPPGTHMVAPKNRTRQDRDEDPAVGSREQAPSGSLAKGKVTHGKLLPLGKW